MRPQVSICIPVFNGATFIGETVESILAQTFADLELIVVDNASTDGTLDRVNAFSDPRVRIIQGPHVDVISNFNRATAACRGQFIKLVCADDTLTPDCVEEQVRALSAYPSGVIAAGRRNIVDTHGRPMLRDRGIKRAEELVEGSEAIALCVRNGTNLIGEPASVLMRASTFGRAGGWRHESPYMVDLDLWFRLLHHGDLVAVPKTVATFRVHGEGWTATLGSRQARQARSLFAREAARNEGNITRADLFLGAIRAQLLQFGRQIIYTRASLRGAPRPPSMKKTAQTRGDQSDLAESS